MVKNVGELLRPGDVKKIFGVSHLTLKTWEKQGKLVPTIKTFGGQNRYSREMIERLVASLSNKEVTDAVR